MRIILKPLFDILTGDVAVLDNKLFNYLIMAILGEIAFRLAFKLVGDAYNIGMISCKLAGVILHWVIRIIIYVIIAYLLRGGIWLYHFAIGMPNWLWLLVAGLIVVPMIMNVLLYARRKGY